MQETQETQEAQETQETHHPGSGALRDQGPAPVRVTGVLAAVHLLFSSVGVLDLLLCVCPSPGLGAGGSWASTLAAFRWRTPPTLSLERLHEEQLLQ